MKHLQSLFESYIISMNEKLYYVKLVYNSEEMKEREVFYFMEQQDYLVNYANYGPYEEYTKGENLIINTRDINKNNYDEYFHGLLNVFRDGIESDKVQKRFFTVRFSEYGEVRLSPFDFFFNLILWKSILLADDVIKPYHLVFEKNFTKKTIKYFLDRFYVKKYRRRVSNFNINRTIDEVLYNFKWNNEFYGYLANSCSIDDEVILSMNDPEYKELLLSDLSNIPLEEVKDYGLKLTEKAIDIVCKSGQYAYEHGLANFWRAGEPIKARQYKEYAINIGTKPNGKGAIYPYQINKSFLMGGTGDFVSYFIDASNGRIAQILEHCSVQDSGSFARILGLNNYDTFMHRDPNYVCDSTNFQELIVTEGNFKLILDKYYRLSLKGVEKVITEEDTHLIGKKIYMRSPMTCASAARGEGICHRCYGEFAYAIRDIRPGKIAAELLTAVITQTFLSAKHLLESYVKALKWFSDFGKFFDIEYNIIKLLKLDPKVAKNYSLCIPVDNIELENEDARYISDEEDSLSSFNEFVEEFYILYKNSDENPIVIRTEDYDKIYISPELNVILKEHGTLIDNKYIIPLDKLGSEPLFSVRIQNDDISKLKDELNSIFNKKPVTCSMNRHEILERLLDILVKGNLGIMSVHCEVLLMNQIRSKDEIFENPNWSVYNQDYEILTLMDSLKKNPSITVNLMYAYLNKTLFSPLSFKKRKASCIDPFFMENPNEYFNSEPEEENKNILVFDESKSRIHHNTDEKKNFLIFDESKSRITSHH